MSYPPALHPGGQPGPSNEHSAQLDLEYANRRLRAEHDQHEVRENVRENLRETGRDHGNATPPSAVKGSSGINSQNDGVHQERAAPGLRSSKLALGPRTEVILVALSAMVLAVIVFCVAVFTVFAPSLCAPTSSPSGVVNLSYGSYQGTSLPNGVDQFLGMRYAAPPTRFSAPQSPQKFSGVQGTLTYGPGCIGSGQPSAQTAEDCMFVDVFAPTKRTSASKLPVFVFIQGGGLIKSDAHFNGSSLVIASNMSMITVTFTYRVGMFGFLASSEVQKNGNLNNGYLDQHQLLQWVQKEIAQFGGDPAHVVLGGQSAGAGSVVNHLTAYGGVDQHLFQAAVMESQSMPPIRNVSQQQFQYDSLVGKTGCNGNADTLNCLRQVSYNDLLSHGGSIPYPGSQDTPVFGYNPVVDGTFITDVPINMFANGQFVHVPTIFGDDTNEGTIFTPRDLKTYDESVAFIESNFPALSDVQSAKIGSMYLFNNTDSQNYWLQPSWAYGELRYICPGIHMSSLATRNSDKNVWNWRYNIATPEQKSSLDFVAHGSELPAIWGPQYSGPAGQAEMLETNNTETLITMQGYWVSFIKTLDPNKLRPAIAPSWDPWDGKSRMLFDFDSTAMETIDATQVSRCGYLSQIMVDLQQ